MKKFLALLLTTLILSACNSVSQEEEAANFQLGTKLPSELNVKVPDNDHQFDEEYFIRLIAGSISISKDEKKIIIQSIPILYQEQIDELIVILEEEKQKYAALSSEHIPELEKLADQYYQEWIDIEYELKQEETVETETVSEAIECDYPAESQKYLMAFNSCSSDCDSPTDHIVFLAGSDDGEKWDLIEEFDEGHAGSVPDVVFYNNDLYR